MKLYKYIKEYLIKTSKTKIIIDAIALLFVIVLGLFISFILIRGIYKKTSQYKNAEYIKAVVIDSFYQQKYDDYYTYKFHIGKNEYKGVGIYDSQSETISVGDTIMVFYDSTDPEYNNPLRDYYRP